jgi:UDP-hydrolysing UDP-N-acetyl-D-glucosamine 2-epimerase
MVLSGKRGGYDAMLPMLQEIEADPLLELQLVVTDQHVREKFGNTQEDITLPISDTICAYSVDDSARGRCHVIGYITYKMSMILNQKKPDLLIIYGDRGEALAGTIAAVQCGIPVAHLQAGDKSGSVDDVYRGMISKAANLLFSSHFTGSERLLKLGEHPSRIFEVGDHHLDPYRIDNELFAADVRHRDDVRQRLYKLLGKPLDQGDFNIILLQHSNSSWPEKSDEEMRETLYGIPTYVQSKSTRIIAIYPCSDPGHDAVINTLHAYERLEVRCPISIHKNIKGELFRELLRSADLLLGNSSAGIIEAPFVGTHALNIGDRQFKRGLSTSIWNVPHDQQVIYEMIKKVPGAATFNDGRYGDGFAGHKTLEIIRNIDPALLKGKPYYV